MNPPDNVKIIAYLNRIVFGLGLILGMIVYFTSDPFVSTEGMDPDSYEFFQATINNFTRSLSLLLLIGSTIVLAVNEGFYKGIRLAYVLLILIYISPAAGYIALIIYAQISFGLGFSPFALFVILLSGGMTLFLTEKSIRNYFFNRYQIDM